MIGGESPFWTEHLGGLRHQAIDNVDRESRMFRMGTPTRIAIVDDHVLFRQGLCALLGNQPEIEVVAQASDAEEGYQAIEGRQVDLVIVDLSLPGSNGIAVARELKRPAPPTKILILTAHSA